MSEPAAPADRWESLLAGQVRERGRLLFRLAYGVLRNGPAAEDVCQQAFMKAWQQRGRIRDPAGLPAWLARVVINESLRLAERQKTERRAGLDRARSTPHADAPGNEPDLPNLIGQALSKLPEATRLVVVLRVMQGMSGNEVKTLLGCSASEVSRRLHVGMEQLRGLLADV